MDWVFLEADLGIGLCFVGSWLRDQNVYEAVGESCVAGAEIAFEPNHVATVFGIWVLGNEPNHTGCILLAYGAENAEIGGGVLFLVEMGDSYDGDVMICGDFTKGTEKTADPDVVVGVSI